MNETGIATSGEVSLLGENVGQVQGFLLLRSGAQAPWPDVLEGNLTQFFNERAQHFEAVPDTSLVLSQDGVLRWTGDPIARLEAGETLLEPNLRLLADERLTGEAREKVEQRLAAWMKMQVVKLLGPLLEIQAGHFPNPGTERIVKGIIEGLGIVERARVLSDVRALSQEDRTALRKAGIRFGAFHLFFPLLLKPAPRTFAAHLHALKQGEAGQAGLEAISGFTASGRTSFPADTTLPKGLYLAAGYRLSGSRAIRIDILERLADLIRPAIHYRPGVTPGEPPPGAADGEGFVVTTGMTSLAGCSGEDFAALLTSLGYVRETRPGPAITVPLLPTAQQGKREATPEEASEQESAAAEIKEAETKEEEITDPGSEDEPSVSDVPIGTEPVQPPVQDSAPEQETGSEQKPEHTSVPIPTPATALLEDSPVAESPVLIEIWHHKPRPIRSEPRPHNPRHRQDNPRQDVKRPQQHSVEPREHPSRTRPLSNRSSQPRPPFAGSGTTQNRPYNKGQNRPSGQNTSAPPRRDRAPDPLSPFAKLLALKAQLETPAAKSEPGKEEE
jgi:ATP-dependent RNA helicase SUPV3L1/SUV3